jgi:hypothetical protein
LASVNILTICYILFTNSSIYCAQYSESKQKQNEVIEIEPNIKQENPEKSIKNYKNLN